LLLEKLIPVGKITHANRIIDARVIVSAGGEKKDLKVIFLWLNILVGFPVHLRASKFPRNCVIN